MWLGNRREFVRDALVFASAAAVLGRDMRVPAQEQPASRKVGPNDRIRVAVIGFHGQGRAHLTGFASLPDTVVTVMCDCDTAVPGMEAVKKTLAEVERRQGFMPEFVQDLRRVMERKDVDVVSIATPNHWHALAAIWAIQAGKDVYVEKPVSHNVWEGRRIVDFARKYNCIVQTGTQSRSMAGMREMLAFIHSGGIGKVTLARGLCYKLRPSIGPKVTAEPPRTVDYDLWLGPAPKKPVTRRRFHYDWHWFWDYGNGDLGNQGIHEMDKARWGLQKNTLCNAVISIGGRVGYEDAGETANTQICVYDYGDSQLIFEVRGLPTKDLLGCRIGNIWYGDKGYVVSTNYQSGAAFTPDGQLIRKFEGGGNHFANFIRAVKSRRVSELTADIEEGHLSSALCHLGNISYRLGKPYAPGMEKELTKEGQEAFARMVEHLRENKVTQLELLRVGPWLQFDPKVERFINHAEANALLSRDYRKGYEIPNS
ncbi:MAG: Gfo/Idh/MocA family oxidoreductase [Gemmatales bacterium]|nr:Gfo/Idh/MocA family oxidoreductase [Gemmatales bacterium]MDW7993184.1 Gfo/Idh/MocA family oxidoreductase [Gemmatales bacterium]